MRDWKKRTEHWMAMAAGTLLGLATLSQLTASPALAKDFNVAGTVDCGVRSGQDCPIGDTISLWTEDISGKRELVTIDITWIRRQLRGVELEQDDAIDLEVRALPEARGGLQALGVTGEGSFVNRLNWGVREAYTTCNDSIRARVGRARDDDEAMAKEGIKRCKDLRDHDDDDDDDDDDD